MSIQNPLVPETFLIKKVSLLDLVVDTSYQLSLCDRIIDGLGIGFIYSSQSSTPTKVQVVKTVFNGFSW